RDQSAPTSFPTRRSSDLMDELFCGEGARSLSSVLYPPPAFDEATLQAQETALVATDYAQAAIGVISAGMYALLAQAGFQPSFTRSEEHTSELQSREKLVC